jgi:hypothetical protein
MPKSFHAVERLAHLLGAAEDARGVKVGDFLIRYLELNTREHSEKYFAYGELIELTRDAWNEVHRLDEENERLFVKPVKQVWQAVTTLNPDHSMEQFMAAIGQEALTQLPYCAYATRDQARDPAIEENELAGLLADINSLLEDIMQADISEELKEFLTEQLVSMVRAITYYKIKGKDVLREGLVKVLGATLYSGIHIDAELKQQQDAPQTQKQKILARFWAIMEKADVLISLGVTAVQFLPPLTKLLGLNPPIN